jgi:predicted nucleotidyltransferase
MFTRKILKILVRTYPTTNDYQFQQIKGFQRINVHKEDIKNISKILKILGFQRINVHKEDIKNISKDLSNNNEDDISRLRTHNKNLLV